MWYLIGDGQVKSSKVTDQKPLIDTSVLSKWPSVGSASISNDGKYALYKIYNQTEGANNLVIQALWSNWKLEVAGVTICQFTEDSRMAVFSKQNDSLGVITLGHSSVKYITGARSFRIFTQGKCEWLAFLQDSPKKELVMHNLTADTDIVYPNVIDYVLSDDCSAIILQTEKLKDDIKVQLVNWVDLATGKGYPIWEGKQAYNFSFDNETQQIAFIVEDNVDGQLRKKICYFKKGMEKPDLLMDNNLIGLDTVFKIDNISQGFSRDGKRLFISLNNPNKMQPKSGIVQVDIWSYTDTKLQSQQLRELDVRKNYAAVIDISTRRLTRLQNENENIQIFESNHGCLAYITEIKGEYSESNWNSFAKPNYYLLFIASGERRKIDFEIESIAGGSPGGKYFICMDYTNLYSYEISSGTMRNITHNLPIPLTNPEYDVPGIQFSGLWFDTWMGDTAILIHDIFDIWQVDISGFRPPINVTNGYGRKHNIEFRLAGADRGKVIPENKRLILSAFNQGSKNNGFYFKQLNQKGDPELLTIGPYYYHHLHPALRPWYPIRAKNAEVYLVTRQRSNESANYFYTSDFKTFRPLSNVYPEKNYNWLNSELISYKSLDGRMLLGILYKPENFNANKKYPVIFHYYEKKSYGLNLYLQPAWSTHDINIPLFVSNGYLVFTPDIHYTKGQTGKSALNSVVGAAKYLMKFPWVDSDRMGIQGHSFGGYETNYLVTHSIIFAAAMSSAGISNMVSDYGSLGGDGAVLQYKFEAGQYRIGFNMWERPDLFIINSPAMRANNVSTPLLMVNNKNDGAVPFTQGVEFFTALRRLGKKVWMLQYDGEGHGIINEGASKDYTIRMTQFFDHYLKGKPAPKWMTQGVPAYMKGINNMQLDLETKTPLSGGILVKKNERNSYLRIPKEAKNPKQLSYRLISKDYSRGGSAQSKKKEVEIE